MGSLGIEPRSEAPHAPMLPLHHDPLKPKKYSSNTSPEGYSAPLTVPTSIASSAFEPPTYGFLQSSLKISSSICL